MTTGRINQVAAFSGERPGPKAQTPRTSTAEAGSVCSTRAGTPACRSAVSSVAHLTASPAGATIRKLQPLESALASRNTSHHAVLPAPSSRSGAGYDTAGCF
jgi:hypothetical protein